MPRALFPDFASTDTYKRNPKPTSGTGYITVFGSRIVQLTGVSPNIKLFTINKD